MAENEETTNVVQSASRSVSGYTLSSMPYYNTTIASTGTVINGDWYEKVERAVNGSYATIKSMSEYNSEEIEYIKKIMFDICDILALMYDRHGPRVCEGLSGIRSFIDSIKVIEYSGRDDGIG